MARSRRKTLLLSALTLGVSLTTGALICEGLLRLVFHDGGRTTFMGPGGEYFEYTYAGPAHMRGPMETGPKAPGVRRIMVMGVSITWGDGVREWTDTYPMRLLDRINRAGFGYDMAVHAYDGKEIDNHLATISGAIERTDPDIVIYQWFINDVEIDRANRPRPVRSWRTWPWHGRLQAWSYLYYVLDFEADRLLPVAGRSYMKYMEQDYAHGTHGWKLFARAFHAWAEHAVAYADRTILLLYPPVPIDACAPERPRWPTDRSCRSGPTNSNIPRDGSTRWAADLRLSPCPTPMPMSPSRAPWCSHTVSTRRPCTCRPLRPAPARRPTSP